MYDDAIATKLSQGPISLRHLQFHFTGIWEHLQMNQTYSNLIFDLSKMYSMMQLGWKNKQKCKQHGPFKVFDVRSNSVVICSVSGLEIVGLSKVW